MYRIKVKNSIFTCPKSSFKYFALSQAIDLGENCPVHNRIVDDKTAKEFLAKLGMKVEEINE